MRMLKALENDTPKQAYSRYLRGGFGVGKTGDRRYEAYQEALERSDHDGSQVTLAKKELKKGK